MYLRRMWYHCQSEYVSAHATTFDHCCELTNIDLKAFPPEHGMIITYYKTEFQKKKKLFNAFTISDDFKYGQFSYTKKMGCL